MLEKLDLSQSITKKEYKRIMPDLQSRLYSLQKTSWEVNLPVLVVFEGWHASGVGRALRKLSEALDPRGFKLHSIRSARRFERNRPWMWRFWMKLPARGEWALFDHSWYGRVLNQRMENQIPETRWRRAYREIVDFERTIADNDHLIIKLFLHISPQKQKRRLEKRRDKPSNAQQGSPREWEQNRNYGDWVEAYEEMFERTDTKWGPWTAIPATDRRNTYLNIYQTILDALERPLEINRTGAGFEASMENEIRSPAQGQPEPSQTESPAADQNSPGLQQSIETTSPQDSAG
jgi:polyphosphate kinase 2 (PPK2 family)